MTECVEGQVFEEVDALLVCCATTKHIMCYINL